MPITALNLIYFYQQRVTSDDAHELKGSATASVQRCVAAPTGDEERMPSACETLQVRSLEQSAFDIGLAAVEAEPAAGSSAPATARTLVR
eukprot:3829967-Pleurochrysis_carterae.AAC.3